MYFHVPKCIFMPLNVLSTPIPFGIRNGIIRTPVYKIKLQIFDFKNRFFKNMKYEVGCARTKNRKVNINKR